MTNELWAEYDNVAYFVGAAYASPQEEARMAELKVLIIAAERRATVERIRAALHAKELLMVDVSARVLTDNPDESEGFDGSAVFVGEIDAILDAEREALDIS